MTDSKLPGNGERFLSADKKYEETVIFVPFFGGKKQNLKQHIKLVNDLGFDAVVFDLSYDEKWVLRAPPFSIRTRQWGLKHRWADEIEEVLNAVPGSKIIFAFSNPCSSSIEALARNHVKHGRGPNYLEVKALICDSGPFVDLWRCNWNFMNYERKIKKPLLKISIGVAFLAFWSPSHSRTIHRDLTLLPKGFPILSIRGWKDRLVSLKSIEKAFDGHDQLALEVLSLPSADHLVGLRDFPDEYVPRVSKFICAKATPI